MGAVPSEIVLPMAGAVAGPSPGGLVAVTAAGVAAHQASAVFWYSVGRRVGHRRCRRWVAMHGRRFGVAPSTLDRAVAWFRRCGARAVLLSRALPVARALVCLPAGAARLGFRRFFAAALLGSTAWCSLLVGIGVALAARAPRAVAWLDRAAWAALALAATVVLARRLRRPRRPRGQSAGER
nr:VTT domain-containing protein [Sphingomonas jejuensis]